MTETVAAAPAPDTSKGLLSRVAGILFAPRATYAAVAARPRVFGALAIVLVLIVGTTALLVSTEVGRQAVLDQQVRQMEAFGRQMSDAQYQQLERTAPYFAYFTAAAQLVFIPLMALMAAGVLYALFTAFLGGEAKFKQVLAVVAHAGLVLGVTTLFVQPLNYVRESLSSPATLAAFVPFLDDASFFVRFLGAIDLIYVWWFLNLSIGLGVLYKRRTRPIAIGLLVFYVLLALVIAAVRTAFAGG